MRQPRKLPEFNGYTVDERLEEFRKVTWDKGTPSMITVPFHTELGQMLLNLYKGVVQ